MYLVCGEALFDVFTGPGASGNRLNLEAVAGGSPYNVAVGLARLDVKAALLGGLSNDHFGQRLLGLLQKEGVDYTLAVNTVVFLPISVPRPGDILQASYRY